MKQYSVSASCLTVAEEIAYILKKADENCDHIEIRKILNVSNT